MAVYDVSGKMLKPVKGGGSLVAISGLPLQQVLIVKVTDERSIKNYKLILLSSASSAFKSPLLPLNPLKGTLAQ